MGKTFGTFGDTSAAMVAGGFFSWFNLEAADEAAGPDEVAYRPSGEAFHDLVSLIAKTGDGGRLETLSLKVRRSFIDDPRQGAFARDIVKSFLQNLAGEDKAMAALADEILFRDARGPVLMRGEPPALPPTPSRPYLVFAGQVDAAAETAGALTLSFNNQEGDFRLDARPAAGKPKGFFERLFGR